MSTVKGSEGEFPVSYSTYEYYTKYAFDADQISSRVPMQKENYFTRVNRMTTVALQGLQINYNRSSGHFNKVTMGQGHLKRGSFPGCAGAWNGELLYLGDYDYNSIHLD